jgi:hypothetical protein
VDTLDTVIDLATAIVKSAGVLWAGPFSFVPNSIVDIVRAKVSGKLQQRRTERFFQDCVDTVAEKLLELINQHGTRVDTTDLVASIYAVRDTFELATLNPRSLMEADLDARTLEKKMGAARSEVLGRALLSESGEHFYNLLMRESCTYAVEFVSALPNYDVAAFAEILKRETTILSNLQRILTRLPDRTSVDDFTADYRRLVIQRLDRMQLFGARLQSNYGRRYPLSVAYISLGAASQGTDLQSSRRIPSDYDYQPSDYDYQLRVVSHLLDVRDFRPTFVTPWRWRYPGMLDALDTSQNAPVAGEVPVERWFTGTNRALLIGEAGSGKSTFLQWLAVRAARADFEDGLARWNTYIPFFIPLRRYATETLPPPELFPMSIGKNIVNAMPNGWVHKHLKSGSALVLIDGLDELKEGTSRTLALEWLEELIESFPLCSYIVTSRPGAIKNQQETLSRFTHLELRLMTPAKIRTFAEHWHDAMRVELAGNEEHEQLSADQSSFLAALETDRHIRALSVNPLLCALLCALNRERHGHLPKDRMSVYRGALEMLLDMRDRERGITPSLEISHETKITLLQDLALYLVRNAWSDAPVDRVCDQIARSSRTLNEIEAEPDIVLQFLIERSGLIRTPSEGRIDFIHRSFQEYLAGKAAIDNDEIGYLLQHSTDDQFRDVIIMAVGHAQPRQAEELLRGLILRSKSPNGEESTTSEERSHQLRLLAIACLQTVRRINPELRKEIEDIAQELLPPDSFDVAPILAGTGQIILDLMTERPPSTSAQAAASIRVASLVGGRDAMLFIADLTGQYDDIEDEVVRCWPEFDLAEYSDTVISRMRWSGRLTITDKSLFPYVSRMQGLKELTVPSGVLSSGNFPSRPYDVQFLRLIDNAIQALESLQGWDDLTHLEIHLRSLTVKLTTLRRFKQLEALRIVSVQSGVLDLGPLAKLTNLRTIQLVVPSKAMIRVNALSELKDLMIYVPPKVAIVGRDALKNRSRVMFTNEFPELLYG